MVKPEILNSDQGCPYTSAAWTSFLESEGIRISMDDKGPAKDSTRIECFWKTLKESHIYLNLVDDGLELFRVVQAHPAHYHQRNIIYCQPRQKNIIRN